MALERKILIVDDDQSLVRMFSDVLSNSGYQVERAFSGAEAVRLIKDFHPELILIDIGLPDMSGLEVLRQVRSHPATKEIIVILITGTSGLAMKIEGFNTGANDYFSKPVNPRELLLKIERFFKTAARQDETLANKQQETLHTIVNTIVHELSTPVAAIRNEVHLSLQEQAADTLKSHLIKIDTCTHRVEEIIKKLQSAIRFVAKEPIPGVQLLDLDESSKR